jgi:hypothetical protein
MKLATRFFVGLFPLFSWLACSNAGSDCDKLGTCNEPPAGSGGATNGPTTSGPTTTGMGGTTGEGGGGAPPAGCNDDVQNGNESDVDCGGSCPPCNNGNECNTPADCESNHCTAQGVCAACTLQSCHSGTFCNGGVCEPLLGLGDSCATELSCPSGHCVDDVCCADDCTGTCRRCDLPGTEGTCTDSPNGQDPDNECEPPNKDCNGAGECG